MLLMYKSKKKLFINLCSLSVFITPISFAISCSSNNYGFNVGNYDKLKTNNGVAYSDPDFTADQDLDSDKYKIAGWSKPFSLTALWNQVRLLKMQDIPWHNGVLYSSMANTLSIVRSFAVNLGWDYNDITKTSWGNDVVFLDDKLVEDNTKTNEIKFNELCQKSPGANSVDLAPLFNIAKSIKSRSDTSKLSDQDFPQLWKDNFFFGAGYSTTKAHGSENVLQNNFDEIERASWIRTSSSFDIADPSQYPNRISQISDSLKTTLYPLSKVGVKIDTKFNDQNYKNKFSVVNSITWIDGKNPGSTVEDIELSIDESNSKQKLHRIINHMGAAPIYPIIDATIWDYYEASVKEAILKVADLYRNAYNAIGSNSPTESSTSLTWNSLLSYLIDEKKFIVEDVNNKYVWTSDSSKSKEIDTALRALNNGSHNILGVKVAYEGVDSTLFSHENSLDFFNGSNNLQISDQGIVEGLRDSAISISKIDNNWRSLSKAFLPLRRVNISDDKYVFIKDENQYDSHLSIPYFVGRSQKEIAMYYKLDPSIFE